MFAYLGHFAAIGTAFCWSFTSLFFTEAGKRIGSFRVNKIRLVFAVIIYTVILTIFTGQPWPTEISAAQVWWLAASGLIGLVIGDGWGFKALVMLGPRVTTLLWSTAPIMATIIAWFLLGEQLHIFDILGILITISGIWWVVSERQFAQPVQQVAKDHPDVGSKAKGVLLGLGAAFGQAAGLVMSKHAMVNFETDLDALPASYIRMLASMIMIWMIGGVRGELGRTIKAFKHGPAMLFSAGGAIMGPFLGVWLSLVAVKMIPAGIAATLNAMTPIIVIPIVVFYYKEKVSYRAVFGAVVAFIGVALLFVGDELYQYF